MHLTLSSAVRRARRGRLVKACFRLILSAALALAAGPPAGPPPALAANNFFTVTSAVDEAGSCVANVCSTLRAAIAAVNAADPADANFITLTAGFTLAISPTLGGLTVNRNLTVAVPGLGGATLTGVGVSGALLTIASGTTQIQNLTVQQSGGSGLLIQAGATVFMENTAILSNTNTGLANQGVLTLVNSTISHNNGGGLTNGAGATLVLTNTTVAFNTGAALSTGGLNNSAGGTATVANTILAENTAGAGSTAPDCQGAITSGGYNLLGDSAGCAFGPAAGDQVGGGAGAPLDPALGPLQFNGGASFTHALQSGSPAVDAAASCPSKDQRGAVRTQGAACDIGAYELPFISLTAPGLTVSESQGQANLTVRLDAATAFTVTAVYSTTDLTARAGQDYSAQAGPIIIPPFSTTNTYTISVPVISDGVYELTETLRLDLRDLGGAGLGVTGTTTITLTNVDPAPVVQWATSAYTVTEGAGPAVLSAVLDRPSELTTTVDYATTAGSARAGADFTAQSGTLSFPPLATAQPITVPVAADAVYENPEAFTVRLAAPVGNGGLGARTTATVTVQNSNPMPAIAFQAASAAIREDTGTAAPVVRLSAASEVTATIRYGVTGGTATPGADYTVQGSGTLTFTPGMTSTTFPVSLVDDFEYEGTEAVTFTLSSPAAATLGAPAGHRLDLLDSESRLLLSLIFNHYNAYDEVEPNDSYVQANGPVISGHNYFGTFKGTRDLDFFYFDTLVTGTIRVEVADLVQSTRINNDVVIPGAQVQLCTAANPLQFCVPFVGYAGGYDPGTTLFRIVANNQPAGRYWVAVVMPDGYPGGRYTLTVTHP